MQYLVISFISSFLLLLLLLKTRLVNIALDQPNHRSLHSNVVPRTGGLALITGALVVWSLMAQVWLWLLLVLFLVTISLIDDVRGLSIRWRFLGQFVACAVFTINFVPDFAWWVSILVMLTMLWMVNLYNFMDGADGLAGGMALFGFGFYGIAAYLAGDTVYALMAASVSAAAFAFLLFNFSPARIFMGDAGSIPLGFLAASMGIYGWQQGLWPAWFPLLVFSPFIVDASVTLFRRLFRKEKIWQAHKSHYYQRMIQMGWSHRKMAIVEYGLMLVTGASAIFLLKQSSEFVALTIVAWILVYCVFMRLIDKRWSAKKASDHTF